MVGRSRAAAVATLILALAGGFDRPKGLLAAPTPQHELASSMRHSTLPSDIRRSTLRLAVAAVIVGLAIPLLPVFEGDGLGKSSSRRDSQCGY
jgi:hypothetical protein